MDYVKLIMCGSYEAHLSSPSISCVNKVLYLHGQPGYGSMYSAYFNVK